jgi:Spy/CpxP family protein refolding chaperone
MNGDAPTRNQARLRASLLLAMVLVAGIALGWVGNDRLGQSPRHKTGNTERLVKKLSKKLDLDAAQQDSLRVILVKRRADIDSLWTDVHPRFQTIRDRTHVQIERILTPEQQEKYRERVAAWEKKRAERRR